MNRSVCGITVLVILLMSFLTSTVDFRVFAQYSQETPYPRYGERNVTVSFSAPHCTKIGQYDLLEMENCSYITTPGYPMLPVRTLEIKLPEESVITKVDVEVKEIPNQGSYQVVPAPFPQFSDSQRTSAVPDMEIYGSNRLFPENWYQQREAYGIDAESETRIKYVFFSIFPLRFLPAQNAVIRADEITVTIQYSIPPERQEASSTLLENLVITSLNLEPYAISLAQWKNSTGVLSRVISTTWIYNQYTGVDNPEKIRNCIRDFMLTYGITYVTIFGDTDHVPIRYAFVNDTRVGEPYVPTDLYYADLDGTWDSNGDGLFADRQYDIIDGLPDVYIGRIPVSLASYAEAVVNKIIGYQSQASGDWMNRIILSAGTTSGDGFSNVGLPGNTILNDYIGDVVSYLNATKLYEQYGNLSTASMGSEINKGALFLNFAGHGDPGTAFLSVGWLFYWVIPGLMWNGFGISDVQSRTNGFKLPVVTAMSCSTARLDDTDCIGEWFVGEPHGGSIAYFGGTRIVYNYFDEWSTWGYMGAMDRMIYETFDSGHTRLGQLYAEPIKRYFQTFIWNYKYAGMEHVKTVMETMLLGDPTLRICKSNSPETLKVPEDCATIQGAIDASYDGDTILVSSGTYYENLIVGKSVSLIGENRINTIIDGNLAGNLVSIAASSVTVTGFTLQGTGVFPETGVSISGQSYVTIAQTNINNTYYGILLGSASNCVLCGNNITRPLDTEYPIEMNYGILLNAGCSNNSIYENRITNNGNGIALSSSPNNLILNNSILYNYDRGISLFSDSSNNTIIGNSLESSYYGITLFFSSSNTISRNYVAHNDYGIMMLDRSPTEQSTNNTISENTIAFSDSWLWNAGMRIEASGNKIYHNCLLNNSMQVELGSPAINIWDDGYPSGGNYWSDYAGADANQDGIGDTSYVIDANNRDRYPLMNSYPGFSNGFESGSFSFWNGTSVSSGETAAIANSLSHHGIYSGKFATNGGTGNEAASCYRSVSSLPELYAREYLYVSASGIVENDDRFSSIGFKAGSNLVASAGWRRAGGVLKWSLLVRHGTNYAVVYSTASPALGKWYCVELHWKQDSVNGLGELWVDGVKVCVAAGKNTANYGSVNRVEFGLSGLVGCASTTVYSDCTRVSNEYIGPEAPYSLPTYSDGFESGSFSAWSGTSVSSGETAAIANSLSHHGIYSGKFATNGEGGIEWACCYEHITERGELYARAYYLVSQSGVVDDGDSTCLMMFHVGSTGINVAYAGWRKVAGAVKWYLAIRDGANTVYADSTTTPVLTKWYCVELHWKKDSVNGLGDLWVDGAKVCSISGKNTTFYGDVTVARCGLAAVYNCGPTIVYADCAKMADDYVGPEANTEIFADGFESGSLSAWSVPTLTTGETRNVVGSTVHHGSYAGQFASDGTGGTERACVYKTVSSASELYARAYVRVSTSGIVENGDRFFPIIFKAGGTSVAFAGWQKTGGVVKWNLIIRHGTGWVNAFSSMTPALDQWYCVELHWKKDAVNGLGELWIDGVKVCSASGRNTANYGDTNQVQVGLPEIINCGSTKAYIDCAVISAAYVGPESGPVQASVHLASTLEEYGYDDNAGSIILDGVAYTLPNDVLKILGTYSVTYTAVYPDYKFGHWEPSGGISVADTTSETTTVTVSGAGTLYAVFQVTYLGYRFQDGFESGSFGAWNLPASTAGETRNVTNNVVHSGTYAGQFASSGNGGTERSYVFTTAEYLWLEYVEGSFMVASSGLVENGDRFYMIAVKAGSNVVAFAGWRMVNGVAKWNLLIRDGTSWVSVYSIASPSLNQWYNIRLEWSASSTGYGKLFVDGVLVCSAMNKNTEYYGSEANRFEIGLPELINCGVTQIYADDFGIIERSGPA